MLTYTKRWCSKSSITLKVNVSKPTITPRAGVMFTAIPRDGAVMRRVVYHRKSMLVNLSQYQEMVLVLL